MKRKQLIAVTCAAAMCATTAMMTSGCTAVAIGGATYATTKAVGTITDRRTTGTVVDDKFLERKISYEIDQKLGTDTDKHVTVTAYNRRVLLSGEISSQTAKEAAGKIAAENTDVREVINELSVQENASVFKRMSDSTLATKVRTRIIADQKVELNQMKVVAERGIVYLIGILTAEENKKACQIAASTSGVERVVSCVEIMTKKEIEERMRVLEENKTNQSEVEKESR